MKKSVLMVISMVLTLTMMFSGVGTYSFSAYDGETEPPIMLPDEVDLSATEYFPPVGDQGGLGSCGTYATIYYQLTYEMNKARGVAATEETILSPKLTYHLCSAAFGGTLQEQNYELLMQQGAPSIATLPYSDEGHLDWFAQEKYWKEAMDCRVESYYTLKDVGLEDSQITSPDDEDLYEIKSDLANGKMLVYSTYIGSWVTDTIVAHPDAPENAKFEGEEIVKYRTGDNGAHGMTLVGYNDNIWVDQNSNSQVDAGEMGAFKIVNSWGDDYANDGFCWIAYDALNKVSAVDGGYSGSRESAFFKCTGINVKDYKEGSDIYLKFTMNTADRVQMIIDFYAEKHGTVHTARFLMNANYRADANRYSFAGTNEATDGTFCYPLDNVAKDLCGENFEDYKWWVTFTDTEADGKPLTVKSVEIVNENTGNTYKAQDTDFSIDGEEKTVALKDPVTNDKTIYYLGYEEPVLYYRTGDGDFTRVKMEYTEERKGSNYKYVIENAAEDIILYFADENGNVDNNGGKYFVASDRISCFATEGVREPLQVLGMGYKNNLPDVNKLSYLQPVIEGGYEPYEYSCLIENLQTGEITEIPYNIRYEASYTFPQAGDYRFIIEVTDQSSKTATYDGIVEIIDFPFEFLIFEASPEYGNTFFTGEDISFYAETDFESIIARGPFRSKYEFVIRDAQGNVCYTETKTSDTYNLSLCVSKISLLWTPYKSGVYTVSVSSTDDNNEYAEKQIQIEVFDKYFGDADGSGRVNVKDATLIQKKVASLEISEVYYEEMADCEADGQVNIKDATAVQKYLAGLKDYGLAGSVVECIPPVTEPEVTEPATEPATEPVTEPATPPTTEPVVERNIVYFTNAFGWSGSIYCYYWSDSNPNMTSWPGQMMAEERVNEYGQKIYTMELKDGVDYVIFSGGGQQTVDIPFEGGVVKYYPVSDKDAQGHYKVANW